MHTHTHTLPFCMSSIWPIYSQSTTVCWTEVAVGVVCAQQPAWHHVCYPQVVAGCQSLYYTGLGQLCVRLARCYMRRRGLIMSIQLCPQGYQSVKTWEEEGKQYQPSHSSMFIWILHCGTIIYRHCVALYKLYSVKSSENVFQMNVSSLRCCSCTLHHICMM